MTTWVTPHCRSQSDNSSSWRVKVANFRFSCQFLPLESAHNTHAVTLSLCTTSPQQQRYTTSILNLLCRWARDACSQEKFLLVLPAWRRRPHAVVLLPRPGPHSYTGSTAPE